MKGLKWKREIEMKRKRKESDKEVKVEEEKENWCAIMAEKVLYIH